MLKISDFCAQMVNFCRPSHMFSAHSLILSRLTKVHTHIAATSLESTHNNIMDIRSRKYETCMLYPNIMQD